MARRVVAGSYSLTGSLAAKQGLQLDPQSLNLTADTSRTTIPAKALWASAHLNDKLTVQNALFPEGILYRTDTLNHPMTRCKLWYSGYFLQTRGIQIGNRKWSGRPDLNRGPHAPQACALPGCATPRRNRPQGIRGCNLQIQRYHLVSSSVKKLRRASRKSSSILRFNCVASVSPGFTAARSPGTGSVALPFSKSRRWRRAPAIVKPSS